MESKLIKITTMITQHQYDKLHKQSYKGKKSGQPADKKTFSEHLREALDEYLQQATIS